MTIREKVEEESPGGRVLSIEDLRKCLGIGPSNCNTPAAGEISTTVDPTKPFVEVILVGHDLRGDFPKLRAEGITFDPHLYYFGCIDTYVIIKDTGKEQFGESLSYLMQHYGLASGRFVKPKNLQKAKFVFLGGHNAGNDAIASLKVAIAQALDRNINTKFSGRSESEDYLTEEFLSKPLEGIKKNMVLLAYDSEGVESNRRDRQGRPIGPATTEHGFGWLNLADVADVPPGKNGINWHRYIQARHWLNWDYRGFANCKYLVGNPWGFWKEFGETQYYYEHEGPVPFHRLFEEISNAIVANQSSGTLEKATIEGISAATEITSQLTIRESVPILKGKNPASRGVSVCDELPITKCLGNEQYCEDKITPQKGKNPKRSSNLQRNRVNFPDKEGHTPQVSGKSHSNVPIFDEIESISGVRLPSHPDHRPEFDRRMPCSTHRTASAKGNSTTDSGQSRSLNGGNGTVSEGNGPTLSYSLASSRGNVATKKGNGPNLNDSIESSAEFTTTNIGNGPAFGDGVALSRANAATMKGSWAQIARGSSDSS